MTHSKVSYSEVIEYVNKPKAEPEQPPKMANLIVRVIGDGLNHYARFIIDLNRLKPVTVNDFTYNVKQESFFLVDRNFIHRFFRRLRSKIKKPLETYHAVYRENEGNPLIVDKPVKGTASSRLLKTIRESTALKKGINELFRGQIEGRKLIFFLLVGVVVVFAVLVLTGQIDLSGLA